jgi:hypothetical protein
LKAARVGYVMLRLGPTPVSLFVIPKEGTETFPEAVSVAHFTPCFPIDGSHAVLRRVGENLICAVGNLPVAELEELVTTAW